MGKGDKKKNKFSQLSGGGTYSNITIWLREKGGLIGWVPVSKGSKGTGLGNQSFHLGFLPENVSY